MGVIKDGIQHICHRQDDIRELNRCRLDELAKINDTQTKILQVLEVIRRELVTQNDMLNDFFDEKEQESEERHTLTVRPAETNGKEALFVVTGEDLASLLEACSGATLRMKKKEADKK